MNIHEYNNEGEKILILLPSFVLHYCMCTRINNSRIIIMKVIDSYFITKVYLILFEIIRTLLLA